MGNRVDKYTSTSEEQFIELMHGVCVGADEFKALQARALKELGPVLMRWLSKERERGTTPGEVIEATASIALNLMLSISITIAKSGHIEQITEAMLTYLLHGYERIKEEGIYKGQDCPDDR